MQEKHAERAATEQRSGAKRSLFLLLKSSAADHHGEAMGSHPRSCFTLNRNPPLVSLRARRAWLPGPCFITYRGKSAQAETGSITTSKPGTGCLSLLSPALLASLTKVSGLLPQPEAHGDCLSEKGQESQKHLGALPLSPM